jgi:hypothetical protein
MPLNAMSAEGHKEADKIIRIGKARLCRTMDSGELTAVGDHLAADTS